MWSRWAEILADDLGSVLEAGPGLRTRLFEMLGYDPITRTARVGGGLISTPMATLRSRTTEVLETEGIDRSTVDGALERVWRAPDPVALAHPLGDLVAVLDAVRSGGRRTAVATSDDREPTLASLASLGLSDRMDAVLCADDGLPNKPDPAMVLALCERFAIAPAAALVIGDSPADLAMGRSAGAGLVVGVRSGVGSEADLRAADVVIDSVADLPALLA
jgi:phosphoglycolate phosphatase-like HAD superfamily hydrolase